MKAYLPSCLALLVMAPTLALKAQDTGAPPASACVTDPNYRAFDFWIGA